MNKLEPVIAFIDERLAQLERKNFPYEIANARIQELQMIRTLCSGLIDQDRLLQNALAR